MEHSESIGKLAAAKAKAQVAFKPIVKGESADVYSQRTGKSYSYDYADLPDFLEAIMPALTENGLALFQPVSVIYEGEKAWASCTTMLAHESGEWIKEMLLIAVVDPMDARSAGSACTYAQRYGLKLLGLASDKDDDGESARGGQHEMKDKEKKGPCPVCGVVGSIIKGKAEFGGGYLCWKKEGGCGTKWPEGSPYPTSAPEEIPMPRERSAPNELQLRPEEGRGDRGANRAHERTGTQQRVSPVARAHDEGLRQDHVQGPLVSGDATGTGGSVQAGTGARSSVQEPAVHPADASSGGDESGERPAGRGADRGQRGQGTMRSRTSSGGGEPSDSPATVGSRAGLRAVPSGPSQGATGSAPSRVGQASTEAPAEAAQEKRQETDPPVPGGGDGSQPSSLTFEHEGETYTTNGMTLAQFEESIGLVRQVETKGKGLGRILLAEVLGVDQKKASRTNCTEQQAAEWIAAMKARLA